MNDESSPVEYRSLLQSAYLKVKEAKSRLETFETLLREPIAIIGTGCRFPGKAVNPDAFWKLLRDSGDGITEIPPDRWDVNEFYDPDPDVPGKSYTRWGGFLDRVDQFDAGFFGISPREATRMDPQQRLLLEVVWEALEDAGQPADQLAGSVTGVFIGICNSEYSQLQFIEPATIDAYSGTGTSLSVAAGRISYMLDLHGPSIAIDTACSSSLVATHLACQSLRSKECNLAVVGGVSMIISPQTAIMGSKMRMLAQDGRCKPFDARADGTIGGEGCGVIVLKRLSDAVADGDNILALIKGSAVNQDGRSSGLTAPNGLSQQSVIRRALQNAGVQPSQVSYVEAHGTGTTLGDPIEVEALAEVFGHERHEAHPCVIGSVKANIGHLAAAAGISGLIKIILCLKHEEIPAQLHLRKLNPNISLDNRLLIIPTEVRSWPSGAAPRFACVSSFGWAGTNCHIVIEESPTLLSSNAQDDDTAPQQEYLLPLSARSTTALQALAQSYQSLLSNPMNDSTSLRDLCYTASVRRTHHDHRLAVLCCSRSQVLSVLADYASSAGGEVSGSSRQLHSGVKMPGRPARVAFLCAGQGLSSFSVDPALLVGPSAFASAVAECDRLIRQRVGWSAVEQMRRGAAASRLEPRRTDVMQICLFTLQVGLAAWWSEWGVEAEGVVGHSVGEVAAAYLSGALGLEQAVEVVCRRGELMQAGMAASGGEGAMAAVQMRVEEAERAIAGYEGEVAVAAHNSATSCVLSGPASTLNQITQSLRQKGIASRKLEVEYAFHSSQAEGASQALEVALRDLRPRAPKLDIYSTVTGRKIGGQAAAEGTPFDASYWRRNVRQRVRLAEAVRALLDDGYDTIIELSPHPLLQSAVTQELRARQARGQVLASFRQEHGEREVMLEGLGRLYAQGLDVDWRRLYGASRGRIVQLPSYPWQRERFWLEANAAYTALPTDERQPLRSSANKHGFVGQHSELAQPAGSHLWEVDISKEAFPYLDDHRIQGMVIVPGAMHLQMVLAAVRETLNEASTCTLKSVDFQKALFLSERETHRIQVLLTPGANREAFFHLYSRSNDSQDLGQAWTLHVTGTVSVSPGEGSDSSRLEASQLADLRARCPQEISGADFYLKMHGRGNQWGPSFQSVEHIWRREGEALGQLSIPQGLRSGLGDYQMHPAVLDACIQVMGATMLNGDGHASSRSALVGRSVAQVNIYAASSGFKLWSHVLLRPDQNENAAVFGDVHVFEESGVLVLEALGVKFQYLEPDVRQLETEKWDSWFYDIQWQEKALPPPKAAHTPPSYLLAPRQITEQIEARVAPLSEQLRVEIYEQMKGELDALSTAYITNGLQELGWQMQAHEHFTSDLLADKLDISLQHRRLLQRLLEILQEDGILRQDGEEWEVVVPPVAADVREKAEAIVSRYPSARAELELLDNCGRHLARAMRDEIDPLQLLFPDGSFTNLEKVYQDSPASRLFNELVGETIGAALQKMPRDRILRVLEIGAGTGGTTTYALAACPAQQTEYFFTDVSMLFTNRARQKFGDYEFVQYQLLDIEQNLAAQGLSNHQFDVIVAANVLHATADLRHTLRQVSQLLAPEGLLVLLEGTSPQRFTDLTFGLTEGWWKFVDLDLRPSHPMLSQRAWLNLLNEAGFAEIESIPSCSTEQDNPAQSVFVARTAAVEITSLESTLSPSLKEGVWLIFTDAQGVGEKLEETLGSLGEGCVMVFHNETYERQQPGRYQLNPSSPEDFRRLFSDIAFNSQERACRGIVHLWSLDLPNVVEGPRPTLDTEKTLGVVSVLHLLQALAAMDQSDLPRLWLVTHAGQMVEPGTDVVSVAQTPLWGLGKTIFYELPELRCTNLDLKFADLMDEAQALFEEVYSSDDEDHVARRQGKRYVGRLEPFLLDDKQHRRSSSLYKKRRLSPDDHEPFRLEMSEPGILDKLALRITKRQAPGPDEVEIEVHAAGLNFSDILRAMNLASGFYDAASESEGVPMLFGAECSGIICALGERVTDLRVGDQVIAMAPGSFSSHVVAKRLLVIPKPVSLSFAEAASIPFTFATALYALRHLGRLSAGERVLIHAAAGGVGLAALQVARAVGAEVLATAGSEAKREYLRGLGVEVVMDSRSLAFAAEVMEATGGRGVDVVLNSLSGAAIGKSLEVLAPYGRFLEIGKRDIHMNSQLPLEPFQRSLSYFAVDLFRMTREKTEMIDLVMREVMAGFTNGAFSPLPITVFPVSQAASAFRLMAQAKQIGKIVLNLREEEVWVEPASEARPVIQENATYLITGGMGGLGLQVADWMVRRGARHLVLLGRSAPTEDARRHLDDLERQGARVVIAQADVSDQRQVRTVLDDIQAGMPPLRGVIHSALVLDDGILLNQTQERFKRVMAPKVAGSWNLHSLTQHLPLDFFVLFSSATSLLGSPGQGNYAAASAFLDGLAHYRQAKGLPGLSINWGPWATVGRAMRPELDNRLSLGVFNSIMPEQGVEILERLLPDGFAQVGVMSINWPQFLQVYPIIKTSPLFSRFAVGSAERGASPRSDTLSRDTLLGLEPGEQKLLVEQYLCQQVARTLGLAVAKLEVEQPLNRLGIDSLMAIELKNMIESDLSVVIPIAALLQGPNIKQLAAEIITHLPRLSDAPTSQIQPDAAHWYEPFPLNEIQQAYWIGRSGAFELGNVATHGYVELESKRYVIEKLNLVLQRLIEQHHMLRAIVLPDGRQQVLEKVPPYQIEVLDLRGCSPEERESRLAAVRQQMSHQVLRSDKWPLFEVRASLLKNRRVRLHISVDFLFADAYSLFTLVNQCLQLYNEPESSLVPLEISFRDYSLAKDALQDSEPFRRSRDYWLNRLSSLPPGPDLPLLRDPSSLTQLRFVRRTETLDAATWSGLKKQINRAGQTNSIALCSAFAEVLATWSSKQHFTVNLTLFNRQPLHPQVNDIIGDFTSVSLLEADYASVSSFEQRAKRLQEQLASDLDNRHFSGVSVLRELMRTRGRSARALMPVVFTSIFANASELDKLGKLVYSISQTPQVWLDHQVYERGDELVINWDAVEDLFPPGLLNDMFSAYGRLLRKLAADEGAWHALESKLVPEKQLEQRAEANATESEVSTELLHTLFARSALIHAARPAVICGTTVLSYEELQRRSNQVARRLRELGARPNSLIAVVMEKGWEQVVAVLGVLTSGAAYLPVEADLPTERLQYLLRQGEVEIALTQSRINTKLVWPEGVKRFNIDDDELWRDVPAGELAVLQQPADTAYVIYTSGSTGLPKGVVIDHGGAVNTILDINHRFAINSQDRVLAVSSLSFDLSVYDIFGTLATGAAIVLPEAGTEREPSHWLELLERHQVTVWNSVPALMNLLVQQANERATPQKSLRLVMLSGDWIPVHLPQKIRELNDGVKIVSLGGATEASIWSIIYPINEVAPELKSIPYGRPMTNQRWHVLNQRMEPCPVWVSGQLYIAGIGLSPGYWRDDEQTNARFVRHPQTGERLYKTGDIGRYLPDGNIEFLGREDFQVKIRGYRVELGEIEAVMGQHPAVKEAVVVAREDESGNKFLAGYVVSPDESASAVESIRSYLREKLPEYMVPTKFVMLASMPLTANGKIDRRALPEPDHNRPALVKLYVAPRTPSELLMADIWMEVLGLEKVGIHDNFFDLGGHSLLATQIVSRTRETFNAELSLRRLFEIPTIAELVQAVEAAASAEQGSSSSRIDRAERSAEMPLSFAQQRLWFLDQLEPNNSSYNIPFGARLKRLVNVTALEQSLNEIIRRHEILRTRFPSVDGQPVQVIDQLQALVIAQVDLRAMDETRREEEVQRLANEEAGTPFNLSEGPLLRVSLLRLEEESYVMLMTMHHIISDGWSTNILLREMATLYQSYSNGAAPELPDLQIQYADFAVWQRQALQGETLEAHLNYWKERLRTPPPPLALPFDRPRAALQTVNGANRFFTLPKSLYAQLQAFSRKEGVTLYMTLLAAFQTLLHRYTAQDDICVGSSIANRNRAETEGLIGLFVNTLVTRADFSGDPPFRQFLSQVRESELNAYDHQDLPFEMIIEALRVERDLSFNPVFQVFFELQNMALPVGAGWGSMSNYLIMNNQTTKFELSLSMIEIESELAGYFQYNTDLFNSATIERMLGHWERLLQGILENADFLLSELPLFTDEERLVGSWSGDD